MSLRIGLATVIEVDQFWPLLSSGFQNACKRCGSDMIAGDLWTDCRSGRAFLCLVHDETGIRMASVWRFERDETDIPVFRCVMMFGHSMKAWLGLAREFIERIARENGAEKLVAEGRNGWMRVFNAEKRGIDYEVNL